MSDEPERIWALHNDAVGLSGVFSGDLMLEKSDLVVQTEYIRADLHRARIEALEAENRDLALQVISSDGQAMDALDRAVKAEADVARLREALEEITGVGFDAPMTWAGSDADWQRRRANLMQSIARAALAP